MVGFAMAEAELEGRSFCYSTQSRKGRKDAKTARKNSHIAGGGREVMAFLQLPPVCPTFFFV